MSEDIQEGPKKSGRPKGAKNKKGYKMSSAAYNQRVNAPLKHGGRSAIMERIIKKEGLSEEETQILSEQRMSLWKKMDAPTVMLMDEYADIKTLIDMKRLQGEDPLNKDIMAASKLLLDISKEYNRLTQVSADTKMTAMSRSFSESDEMVIDITPEDE